MRDLSPHCGLGGCQGRSRPVHGRDELRKLPQRHCGHRETCASRSGWGCELRQLPHNNGVVAVPVQSHSGHRRQPVFDLPQRRFPTCGRPPTQSHSLPDLDWRRSRQLRYLPPEWICGLGASTVPWQCLGCWSVRRLSHRSLSACARQAQHACPCGRDKLRELPSVISKLVDRGVRAFARERSRHGHL